jgi:hypothetical protein
MIRKECFGKKKNILIKKPIILTSQEVEEGMVRTDDIFPAA